jgi:hypothetical protein
MAVNEMFLHGHKNEKNSLRRLYPNTYPIHIGAPRLMHLLIEEFFTVIFSVCVPHLIFFVTLTMLPSLRVTGFLPHCACEL